MPMEALSHLAGNGRLLLAGAALCAAQSAVASDRRSINVGAVVMATSQCRVDSVSGSRCSGNAPAPKVTSASDATQAPFGGELVLKVSPSHAALDSRKTVAPSRQRIVLTIAP